MKPNFHEIKVAYILFPPNTILVLSYVNRVTGWQGLCQSLTHHLMIIWRQCNADTEEGDSGQYRSYG